MLSRNFIASAYHGHQNQERSELVVNDVPIASAAAKALAEKLCPGADVYPGRVEPPRDGKSTWSFGWSGSGLRIWVTETS